MKVFNYNQYIKCIHTLRLNAILQLAEESTQYKLNYENKKYSNEKSVKKILKNKKEVVKFINQFLKPKEPIKADEILMCEHTLKRFKTKKPDLLYKLKNQETFFLIEYETNIDNSKIYKLLNYCLDIMQQWCHNQKIEKKSSYPIIVPIIIYAGSSISKGENKFKQKQVSDYVFESYKIHLDYNIIDINKISKQKLLENNTIFSYLMLLVKSKNSKELVDNLNLIIYSIKEKEKLKQLYEIIVPFLENKIPKDLQQNIKNKLKIAG